MDGFFDRIKHEKPIKMDDLGVALHFREPPCDVNQLTIGLNSRDPASYSNWPPWNSSPWSRPSGSAWRSFWEGMVLIFYNWM